MPAPAPAPVPPQPAVSPEPAFTSSATVSPAPATTNPHAMSAAAGVAPAALSPATASIGSPAPDSFRHVSPSVQSTNTERSPSTRPWELTSYHAAQEEPLSATYSPSVSHRPWEATSRASPSAIPSTHANAYEQSASTPSRSPSWSTSPPPTTPSPRVPVGYTPFPSTSFFSSATPVAAKSSTPAQPPARGYSGDNGSSSTSGSGMRWFQGARQTLPPPVPPKPASLRRYESYSTVGSVHNSPSAHNGSLRREDSNSSTTTGHSYNVGPSGTTAAPPTPSRSEGPDTRPG